MRKRIIFTVIAFAAEGGEARIVAKLYGGQGTINVNSWSPDSGKIAFVSYAEPRGERP